MPKPKTLFVHIGVHKTGSTAMQSYFGRHLRLLRWLLADLELPKPTVRSGRKTARCRDISDDLHEGGSDGAFTTQAEYLALVTESRRKRLLISEERLYNFPRGPEYFEPFLRVCQVRIVAFLRRQDRYAESMYRQLIKNSSTSPTFVGLTFQSFLQMKMAERQLDWYRRLEPWRQVFGEENVTVVPYSEDASFDSVSQMAKVMSVPAFIRMPSWIHTNPSLSCETVEMVRRLTAEGRVVTRSRIRDFDGAIPQPTSHYLDERARRELVAAFEDSNRGIGERYGCDMSPLLPGSLSQPLEGRVFDERTFDYAGLLPVALSSGLTR